MRALVQRVRKCSVRIHDRVHSSIGPGMLVFLGVGRNDSADDATKLAGRCATLRMFDDEDGKMNRSVQEVHGSAMVVSQFTLYGDTRKGTRPSFTDAAPPDKAEPLYGLFTRHLASLLGEDRVATGVFKARMDVDFVNEGPVTLLVESGQIQEKPARDS